MTWDAFVRAEWPVQMASVYLVDRHTSERLQIVEVVSGQHPTVQNVPAEEVGPSGLWIPLAACEPLRDALDVYLGRPHDDYRARYEEARDALEHERRRIDHFLFGTS